MGVGRVVEGGGAKSSAVCAFCKADLIKPRLQHTKWPVSTCRVAEAARKGAGRGAIQGIATRRRLFCGADVFFFLFHKLKNSVHTF